MWLPFPGTCTTQSRLLFMSLVELSLLHFLPWHGITQYKYYKLLITTVGCFIDIVCRLWLKVRDPSGKKGARIIATSAPDWVAHLQYPIWFVPDQAGIPTRSLSRSQ